MQDGFGQQIKGVLGRGLGDPIQAGNLLGDAGRTVAYMPGFGCLFHGLFVEIDNSLKLSIKEHCPTDPLTARFCRHRTRLSSRSAKRPADAQLPEDWRF